MSRTDAMHSVPMASSDDEYVDGDECTGVDHVIGSGDDDDSDNDDDNDDDDDEFDDDDENMSCISATDDDDNDESDDDTPTFELREGADTHDALRYGSDTHTHAMDAARSRVRKAAVTADAEKLQKEPLTAVAPPSKSTSPPSPDTTINHNNDVDTMATDAVSVVTPKRKSTTDTVTGTTKRARTSSKLTRRGGATPPTITRADVDAWLQRNFSSIMTAALGRERAVLDTFARAVALKRLRDAEVANPIAPVAGITAHSAEVRRVRDDAFEAFVQVLVALLPTADAFWRRMASKHTTMTRYADASQGRVRERFTQLDELVCGKMPMASPSSGREPSPPYHTLFETIEKTEYLDQCVYAWVVWVAQQRVMLGGDACLMRYHRAESRNSRKGMRLFDRDGAVVARHRATTNAGLRVAALYVAPLLDMTSVRSDTYFITSAFPLATSPDADVVVATGTVARRRADGTMSPPRANDDDAYNSTAL